MVARNNCPPVEINMDAVVEEVKKSILKERPDVAPVEGSVNRVSGLGKVRLMEPQVSPARFFFGFVTIPSVVNFSTKLMQAGAFPLLPKVDLGVSRGIAAGVTLVGTVLSGGKSFLLGAFLGQVPSTLDTLADVAIAEIVSARGPAQASAPIEPQPGEGAATKGIGATPDEELLKLRRDLEAMSGLDEEETADMEGVLVVN